MDGTEDARPTPCRKALTLPCPAPDTCVRARLWEEDVGHCGAG